MFQFVLALASVVMIGKARNGNAETNDGDAGQEHEDENQGPIHLVQMHEQWLTVIAGARHGAGIFVPVANTDGREAEANQSPGGDDRSAQCAHGVLRLRD